jgi:hypothetical protein
VSDWVSQGILHDVDMAPDSLALVHAHVHVSLRLLATEDHRPCVTAGGVVKGDKGTDTTASCCMVAQAGEGGAPRALVSISSGLMSVAYAAKS